MKPQHGAAAALADPAPTLSESEERFRDIANAAPVMIWISDASAACTWFNKVVLDFTGRPMADALGMGFLQFIHPADQDLVARTFLESHLDHTPVRIHFRARRHDGQWRVLDENAVARFAADGSFMGFIGSCMDVTEQHTALEALRESEEKLRLATDNAGIGLWDFDVLNGVSRPDARVKQMFGIPPETEATNDEFFALVHESDRRAVTDAFAETLDAEKRPMYDVEYRVIGRDGIERWIAAKGRGVFDAQGRCVRVIGTAVDITARKIVEQRTQELNEKLEQRVAERTAALAQSEKNIRTIFETSHLYQGLIAADGTLLYANRTSLAGIGAALDDVVGRPYWDTPWFESRPGLSEHVKAAVERVAAGQAEHVQMSLDLPIGARIFDFSFRPVKDDAGHVVSIVPEAVDITERVHAEQALQQAQKMEAIGNLTGGIAHDFNNLLQGVTGSLDLIRRKAEDAARVRQWAEAGLLAADRGAKLTAQLLAFSRAQKLELRPLSLALLLSNMRELLERTLGPSVRVRVTPDDNLPPVLGDETQLELAVLNLAINARDAMPEGGDLTIVARRRTLGGDSELPRGDYVELSVTDTGCGMPADVAARAFDPFFTTKGVGKGTGLGLSQVYGMARQAGGSARLRSAPGEGTTASLYLRFAAGSADKSVVREVAEKTPRAEAARILVVDDDPDVRRFFVESLGGMGHAVTLAENGSTALEILARASPDLMPDVMIVDYAMPGMTGAELSKRARVMNAGLPIIFASGYAETSALERAADEKTFVLRKPFRLSELQRALSRALGR